MKTIKLTWDQIAKQFDQQWVELVDYDWPEGIPYPVAGVVRAHAKERKAFYRLANEEPRPRESAILFVGKLNVPTNTVLCSGIMGITRAGA